MFLPSLLTSFAFADTLSGTKQNNIKSHNILLLNIAEQFKYVFVLEVIKVNARSRSRLAQDHDPDGENTAIYVTKCMFCRKNEDSII